MHPLREWRKRHGVSLEKLGERSGLSLYAVHRIETGKSKDMSLGDAAAIVAATHGKVSFRALAKAIQS